MLPHEPLKCQYNLINFVLSMISLLFFITGKARKPNLFKISSTEVEENRSVGLNCSADVGAPKGNIKLWKFAPNSNTPEMIIHLQIFIRKIVQILSVYHICIQ